MLHFKFMVKDCELTQKVEEEGRVVRAPDLKSDTELKFLYDNQLDLIQVVPGSTPLLRLRKANGSTSRQLGFLTC